MSVSCTLLQTFFNVFHLKITEISQTSAQLILKRYWQNSKFSLNNRIFYFKSQDCPVTGFRYFYIFWAFYLKWIVYFIYLSNVYTQKTKQQNFLPVDLQNPKSMTLICSLTSIMMFSHFKSRWAMLSLCRYRIALTICWKK